MPSVRIRSQYAAPPGRVFVAFDLSQAESWVTSHLAREYNMIRSLRESDIHTDTAAFLFHKDSFCQHQWKKSGKEVDCTICNLKILESERYVGKQNNHANSYGQGPEVMTGTVNKQSDKPPYVTVTVKECKVYQKDWHMLFPSIKMWHTETQEKLRSDRTLITPYGFKRQFYGQLVDKTFKEAYAFVPQSTVLDHFIGTLQPDFERSGGLLEVDRQLCNDEIFIVNMSHDSAVIECPEKSGEDIARASRELMTRPMIINDMEFTIPVDIEIGYDYGNMKGVK